MYHSKLFPDRQIGSALDFSERNNTSVFIESENVQSTLEQLKKQGELNRLEVDYCKENDGSLDVWGYDPEEEQEDKMVWRVNLREE